jgi:hypothetical protein
MVFLQSSIDPFVMAQIQDKDLKAECSGNELCGPVDRIDEDGAAKNIRTRWNNIAATKSSYSVFIP